MRKTLCGVLAVALCSVGTVSAASAPSPPAPEPVLAWSYDDKPGERRAEVDVLSTELDIKVQGYYRVRIHGRDFVKNKTDLVGLWFDTDKPGSPNFYVLWYLGRTPTPRDVGHMHLKSMNRWLSGPRPKLRCPEMKHQVNYATDVITVMVPRRCLGYPDKLRWAGQVFWVNRWDDSDPQAPGISVYGPHDYFPAAFTFPPVWVA